MKVCIRKFYAVNKIRLFEYYKNVDVNNTFHLGGELMTISFMPENPNLAAAYVPFQEFKNLYSTEKALKRATIFKDLDIPFETYKDNPIMNPFIK